MDPFIAEIRIFPFNFAPTGWAQCNGQLLSIPQNTALFSLLGTTYGGNGQTNFALPDMRERSPLQHGQGAGLSSYSLGQMGGSPSVQLLVSEIPAHSHSIIAGNSEGTTPVPTNNAIAGTSTDADRGPLNLYHDGNSGGTVNMGPLSPAGQGLPHNNMMPYLALNICIALQGIFPQHP